MRSTTRRSFLSSIAGFGLALAACASSPNAARRYLVLESHRFT